MQLKNLLLTTLLVIHFTTHAETIIFCPSVAEIKQHQFHTWLPLYKEGEELASAHDVATFMQSVRQFVTARWDKSYLESGHCFYQGNDPIIEKIIFAHDAFRPKMNFNWQWIELNAQAVCIHNDVDACGFIQ